MMIQLNPPIPIETPRGKAQAMFIIDYSPEHDLLWTAFLDENGECWTFSNSEVRAQKNMTLGRRQTSDIPVSGDPRLVVPELSYPVSVSQKVVPMRRDLKPMSVSMNDPGPFVA